MINLTVHQCSVCFGDTDSFCTSCQCELCLECKEDRVNHLLTIDHNVVTYHEKLNFLPNQKISNPHSDNVYGDNLQLSAHSNEDCEKIWVGFQSSDCSICKNKKNTDSYMLTQHPTQRDNYTMESLMSIEVKSSLAGLFSWQESNLISKNVE